MTPREQAARAAFEECIEQDRPALLRAWLYLAGFLVPFFVYWQEVPDLGPLDLAICVLALSAMAFNIVRVPRQNLYARYRWLSWAAALSLFAWVASALFGAGAAGLAADRLPWITPLLPVGILYLHTLQLPIDADRVGGILGFSLLSVFALHYILPPPASLSVSAVWFGMVLVFGLLHARLLLALHVGVQGAVHSEIAAKVSALEAEAMALRRELAAARQDPTTSVS